MANYLTEAQMNLYFGWVQGSDMPSVYVHLSGRDVDDAILKANGVTSEKEISTNQGHDQITDSTINLSSIIESKIKRLVDERVKEVIGN